MHSVKGGEWERVQTADFIGNWFGGEAISLALDYTHSEEFRAAGYEAMVVDGKQYGEVRQYGNFSFARIYESGHEMPYYQRKFFFFFFFQKKTTLLDYCFTDMNVAVAALAYFNRTLNHYDLATGEEKVTANLTTSGPANTTHTESSAPLTSSISPEDYFPIPIYPTAAPAH